MYPSFTGQLRKRFVEGTVAIRGTEKRGEKFFRRRRVSLGGVAIEVHHIHRKGKIEENGHLLESRKERVILWRGGKD